MNMLLRKGFTPTPTETLESRNMSSVPQAHERGSFDIRNFFFARRSHTSRSVWGFTLIELLVVIGIIVILAVVVLLIINPLELLRQARDATRASDMSTLNSALSLYSTDSPGGSMGQLKTVYVSLVDDQATTSQGTDCASLNLPNLPVTWGYHCAASSTLRANNGTGWVPVNFQGTSFSAPITVLPVDPVNDPASGLYYTYQRGSWELTSAMESAKYNRSGSNDVTSKDNGKFADLLEVGSNLTLLPINRIAILTSTSTPQVAITSPTFGAGVSGTVMVSASATDPIGISSVQFLLDGDNLGVQDTSFPYQTLWDTTLIGNGVHNLTAYAVNPANHATTSAAIPVSVQNFSSPLPALVQFTVTSNAPAPSCSAQLNSSVTPGNLLVFTVDTNSSTAILTVSDNRGNIWNTANSQVSAAGTQSIFYALNAASGVTNVTVTITNWSDALRSCELVEYSGITGFDIGHTSNGTGAVLTSGGATTNFANELLIGGGSVPACTACTPTPGPGFIIVVGSARSFQEYRVVTVSSTYSVGTTMNTSTPWLMNMATFH